MQQASPVHAALVRALLKTCEKLWQLVYEKEPLTDEWIQRLSSIPDELAEIANWLGQPAKLERENAEAAAAEALRWALSSGATAPQALMVAESAKRARKRRPGRSVSHVSRQLAVRYLDEKTKRPKLNLPTFTRQCCQCGENEHGLKCQERIRQQVIALCKFLKEHDESSLIVKT
jgi:hypothetical protein